MCECNTSALISSAEQHVHIDRNYVLQQDSQSGPNIAAVLLKKDDLQLKEIPMPHQPKENEALIAMRAVGICGSDVH